MIYFLLDFKHVDRKTIIHESILSNIFIPFKAFLKVKNKSYYCVQTTIAK